MYELDKTLIADTVSNLSRFPLLPNELKKRGLSLDSLEVILDNDIVYGAWSKRSTAVEQAPYSLSDPDSLVSVQLMEWLQVLYQDIVANLLRSRLFGLSVTEVVFKEDGNYFVPSALIPHRLERFRVTQCGDMLFNNSGLETSITDDPILSVKLLALMNRRTPRYMAGTPMLAHLYYVWLLSANALGYLSKYAEKYSVPSVVGTTPYGIDQKTGKTSVEQLRDALLDLVDAGVGAFNDGTVVTSMTPGNDGGLFDLTESIIKRRVDTFLLGQTLTSDNGSVGSQALGTVHMQVMHEITSGDITLVTPVMQRFVNNLCAINFPGSTPPLIQIGYPSRLNSDRAARDSILHNMGVRFTDAYFTSNYNLSDKDLDGILNDNQ